MSLVHTSHLVRPDKFGRPITEEIAAGPEAIDDLWTFDFDTTFSARIPRGAIAFSFAVNPAPYPSWGAGASNGLSQGSDAGFYFSVSTLPTWRGETIECFLLWSHTSATQSGNARMRLDLGPRQNQEAAGAPNDAASQRVFTTLNVGALAGDNQNVPRYNSLGQFTIDADDVMLIGNLYRLGADVLDTFGAFIAIHGIHAVRV